jgi:hypothetical protein
VMATADGICLSARPHWGKICPFGYGKRFVCALTRPLPQFRALCGVRSIPSRRSSATSSVERSDSDPASEPQSPYNSPDTGRI